MERRILRVHLEAFSNDHHARESPSECDRHLEDVLHVLDAFNLVSPRPVALVRRRYRSRSPGVGSTASDRNRETNRSSRGRRVARGTRTGGGCAVVSTVTASRQSYLHYRRDGVLGHSRRARSRRVDRSIQQHPVNDMHDPIREQDVRLDDARRSAPAADVVASRVKREAERLPSRGRPVRVRASEEGRIDRRVIDQLRGFGNDGIRGQRLVN